MVFFSGEEKTAAIYARVSTARQAADDLPLEGQMERCEAKAAELGARVVARFVDPGVSGRDENRPEFQRAIEFCETCAPTYLVTWSTSRFARDKVHAGAYKVRLQRAGTDLVYVSVDIDRKSDGGWLLEGVMELLDEFQSRQTASDTTRSMIRNAKAGYWNGGNPPFGFQPRKADEDPRRKKLEPNPGEAWIVQRIFDMKLSGLGTRVIAAKLAESGIDHRGRPWQAKAVGSVLRSRAVIGQTVFGKKADRHTGRRAPESDWIIVDSHEPIVPLDTWSRAQKFMDGDALNASSGSAKSTHLFTGILRCDCGSPMQIESAKGRSRRYYYYRCADAATPNSECPGRRLPAREMDEWLVDLISSRIFTVDNLREVCAQLNESVGRWARDRENRRRGIVASITQTEDRARKIYELFEEHGRDTPHLGDLTRRLREHNTRLRALEDELARVDAESAPDFHLDDSEVSAVAGALRDILRQAANPKKIRGFFSTFIDAVHIGGERARIEYKPERLVNANRASSAVPSTRNWLPGTGSNRRPSD